MSLLKEIGVVVGKVLLCITLGWRRRGHVASFVFSVYLLFWDSLSDHWVTEWLQLITVSGQFRCHRSPAFNRYHPVLPRRALFISPSKDDVKVAREGRKILFTHKIWNSRQVRSSTMSSMATKTMPFGAKPLWNLVYQMSAQQDKTSLIQDNLWAELWTSFVLTKDLDNFRRS